MMGGGVPLSAWAWAGAHWAKAPNTAPCSTKPRTWRDWTGAGSTAFTIDPRGASMLIRRSSPSLLGISGTNAHFVVKAAYARVYWMTALIGVRCWGEEPVKSKWRRPPETVRASFTVNGS